MTLTLEVTKREKGSGNSVDLVKGVVYGPKQPSTPISINSLALSKAVEEAGESTIINLKGLDTELEVLIHDVAFNAEKGGIEHIDFYAIEQGKELTTNVALEFINEAPAEKMGAVVNKVLHDIEVTCKPNDLPSHIDVDLAVLVAEDSQIRVSDLKLPAGVVVENDAEDIVVNVVAVQEESEEVAAIDMSAIEVEAKGKATEETEDAE